MSGSRITDSMKIVGTGSQAGSTSALIMTSIKGQWVKFKAVKGNAGNVYIGITSGVTKIADQTTNATCGFELAAQEETDWLPAPDGDMAGFYRICDNAGDDLTYIMLGSTGI